jgi:hypothetical protein
MVVNEKYSSAPFPYALGDCIIIASGGERQSGSKALECGSFRLWEIADFIE